ncbi:DUF4625 domain-containing protein [uncultured Draconibacterium sp.]|uniref:DUF4625 domain-containing protein n=1 Tax=uncultured Draconibacterium sp. TaxID=1573823 RepID=UPI003260F00C
MNKRVFLVAIILGAATLFTACEDDGDLALPEITIMELGEGSSHSNDHTAIIGGEVHIEVEIIAEGKINTVQIIIHSEGEHKSVVDGGEWELDTTYTKFSGLKNTTFHEHLEIADWAEPGEYHFDFIVTDLEGNQSSADAELELVEE